MYRQIPSTSLGNDVDLVEQAVIAMPMSHFSKMKNIRFENDCDDLDYYEAAFFMLDDHVPFALFHYRGNLKNSTSIYLDRKMSGNVLRKTVRHILEMFDAPRNSITWAHED